MRDISSATPSVKHETKMKTQNRQWNNIALV